MVEKKVMELVIFPLINKQQFIHISKVMNVKQDIAQIMEVFMLRRKRRKFR
jgi:hypothetical protein